MTSYKKLYENALNELSSRGCFDNEIPCIYNDNCIQCWDEYLRQQTPDTDVK